MFSVIFEVRPNAGRMDDYLALANHLKPTLQTIDGFVDVERFDSLTRPGWLLSHSTWRDEKSVVRWRTEAQHHIAQGKGRFKIFRDYHLRVGDVTADTHPPKEAPVHEQRFDETEVGRAKLVTFTEITAKDAASPSHINGLPSQLGLDLAQPAVVEHDLWKSIYTPGKFALLVSWTIADAAQVWTPNGAEEIDAMRHRKVRVVRDYGRYDRREAPQYYADVDDGETRYPEPVF